MIHSLFPTQILQAPLLSPARLKKLNSELIPEIEDLQRRDSAGRSWSKKNYRHGYTSYGSMSRLFETSSTFETLTKHIDVLVKEYVESLSYDLRGSKLAMTNLWANVMKKGAYHTAHIHPHSVISGTYYVQVPPGSSPLKIEDPRLGFFMKTPLHKKNTPEAHRRFFSAQPKVGDVILFEGWLRHEVPEVQSKTPRISLSFNYNFKA